MLGGMWAVKLLSLVLGGPEFLEGKGRCFSLLCLQEMLVKQIKD